MGDRRKCQTYTASPAEPGGLPVMLGPAGSSESVEGFGCRPIAAMRLAPWPASESLQ